MVFRMDITKRTAERVAAGIESAGLTALAVSEETGIPRTTLHRRLTGTSPFTITELGNIATLLNVAPESLIGATDTRAQGAA